MLLAFPGKLLASCQWFYAQTRTTHIFQKMYKSGIICNVVPQRCPVSNHINRYITPVSTDACDSFLSRLIALTEFIFKCLEISITLSWADGKIHLSCFRRLYQLHVRVLCCNMFMRWVSVPQIRHLDCKYSASAIKPHNSFIIRPY